MQLPLLPTSRQWPQIFAAFGALAFAIRCHLGMPVVTGHLVNRAGLIRMRIISIFVLKLFSLG